MRSWPSYSAISCWLLHMKTTIPVPVTLKHRSTRMAVAEKTVFLLPVDIEVAEISSAEAPVLTSHTSHYRKVEYRTGSEGLLTSTRIIVADNPPSVSTTILHEIAEQLSWKSLFGKNTRYERTGAEIVHALRRLGHAMDKQHEVSADVLRLIPQGKALRDIHDNPGFESAFDEARIWANKVADRHVFVDGELHERSLGFFWYINSDDETLGYPEVRIGTQHHLYQHLLTFGNPHRHDRLQETATRHFHGGDYEQALAYATKRSVAQKMKLVGHAVRNYEIAKIFDDIRLVDIEYIELVLSAQSLFESIRETTDIPHSFAFMSVRGQLEFLGRTLSEADPLDPPNNEVEPALEALVQSLKDIEAAGGEIRTMGRWYRMALERSAHALEILSEKAIPIPAAPTRGFE